LPAFKLAKLGPVVESLLFEEFLMGNLNWVPDWELKIYAKVKRGVVEKEDSWRRVADDLVRMGRIKKLKGKAMYKHKYCPDNEMKARIVGR